ncbi:hypothetical protein Dsui_2834 [Azospira oryzae PS]|uniref:Thioredoxin-like fold domain-containing protein n=1 Tax=Azospira oryzae (strain ATCC BAA-33 / DSM 13638 / PS) TaxID=640081 RepID=G8QFR0_AZOOP|nr:thioredoxin fold domain-containing protein [Azospira oryzae]AEV27173.1 hypothetical protein Dsui_2834 [Azospira oryzae PS]
MEISTWKRSFLAFLMATAISAQANERDIAAAAKRFFGLQVTAVHESLIPGLYGINTNPSEVGPRLFMDDKLTVYGNFVTGYAHLEGPAKGRDLTPQEAQELYRSMLARLPKDKFITYRFGDGSREVLLFTAYDCPSCRAVEKSLLQQAKQLNATVYLVPTALRYQIDPASRIPVQEILCAKNRELAWQNMILKGQRPVSERCNVNPDDYAYLSRAFPVKFPTSVPTAVTLWDGKIYMGVSQKFAEVFGGR